MAKSLDEAFARLGKRALALNEKTGSANELIERANRELSAMQLGVTYWLPGVLPFLPEEDAPTINGEVASGFQLGYAKAEGVWQLAIRIVAEHSGYVVAPLARQSREIRIVASDLIQRLIEQLTLLVEDVLEGTEA